MDPELIAKLMKACIEHDLPMSIHVQQKEPVKIVFSQNFITSGEYEQICREIGSSPGEFTFRINKPTGSAAHKHTLYISKDIEPEHFQFSVHKLKRNAGALSDCLTDLMETWAKDSSGKLKKHHSLNEKMSKGYLKIRETVNPDTDFKFTHEEIKNSILNYQLWALTAKGNSKVWFQKWDLSAFLRSNKAIPDWCYDREEMIGKVGEQYFEDSDIPKVKTKEEIEEDHQRDLSFMKMIKESVDKGRELKGDFLEFWETHQHLLDEIK